MSSPRPVILPQWLRRLPPGRIKPVVREALCWAADAADWMLGRLDPLTPPARLRVRVGCFASFIRKREYRAAGLEFVAHLGNIAGLTAHSRVLDIGCGCGRVAAPLVPLLGTLGTYDGFDPDREAIDWCRANIEARYPNFRFAHADLSNTHYNPAGRVRAETFRFPYPDRAFDVILLKSIFTHLPRPQVLNYLGEIARMLSLEGRCLATWYLLNDVSNAAIAGGASAYAFPHQGDGCRVLEPDTPDYLVAYDEQDVRVAVSRAGLRVCEPIRYGSWGGRADALSFQDLMLLVPQ